MTILLLFVVWAMGWALYFRKELIGDICLVCLAQEAIQPYWLQLTEAYKDLEDSYENWATARYDQILYKLS